MTSNDSSNGAKEMEASTGKPTAAPALPAGSILWLVVGHLVMGVTGACIASRFGHHPTPWGAAFIGLVVSQASLLGIWCALGTSPWWMRIVGIVMGLGFLVPLLGIGIDENNWATFVVVVGTASVVTGMLLIVRFCRVAIHPDTLPVEPAGRIQFTIRHLMILTFVVACTVAIGKLLQPHFSHGYVSFRILLFALTFSVVGLLPIWFVLATRQPVLYSLGLVVVGACLGCWLGWRDFEELVIWATATTMEVISVVVSLFVARSCGYRLVRLPRRKCDTRY